MTAQFTPGPWRVAGKKTGVVVAPDGPKGESIVHICKVGAFLDRELLPFNGDRWNADARLIAAAPAMLAALEWIEPLDMPPVVKDRIRAAIAQARGQS